MHSSINVANKLLKIAKEEGRDLTPMQLLKLVYLCHGWMLGLYGRHLIKDPIEAWAYGPVIKDLYNEIKKYRSSPVDLIPEKREESFDEFETDLINQVYNSYREFSGLELSSLTHLSNSPWDITIRNNGQNTTISNDLIQDYYQHEYFRSPVE